MKIGELSVGALVKERSSSTLFYVAAQNHPGYGGTTLVTKYIIGVRAFDAKEPENPDTSVFTNRKKYGNNDYAVSNIHQWLNTDQSSWYQPTHAYDAAPTAENVWYGEYPYDQKPGFLSRFSPEFRNSLLTVDIPYAVRLTREEVELRTVPGKVFLPSRTEINYGDEAGVAEGTPFALFQQDPYLTYAVPSPEQMEKYGRAWNPPCEYATWDEPGIFDPKLGWKYWLRSACSIYSYLARYMAPTFRLSYDKVCNDVTGIRPAMNLDPETTCEKETFEDSEIWIV